MLIAEKYGNKEITWYKGVHISRDEIITAFNVPAVKMPARYGIGPLQPMWGYVNMRLLRMLFIAGFGILFAAQIFFSANARQETVFSNTFIVPDSLPGKGIVSDPFTIQPSSSNLQVTIVAEVLDSWFSADITLVNEGTGKEYSLEKGVEYYSGYSDAEFWSEGSKQGRNSFFDTRRHLPHEYLSFIGWFYKDKSVFDHPAERCAHVAEFLYPAGDSHAVPAAAVGAHPDF